MIMVGSQSVASEDVKGEDQKRGDADRDIKNVKHADDLHGARWKEPAGDCESNPPPEARGRDVAQGA
jgi:hypothetical protein